MIRVMKRSFDKTEKAARREFTFDCKSDPKEVRNIEPFLNKINVLLRLDDGAMYRLLLCCTEAVNNAILHGNHSDPSKLVRLKCTILKTSLVVVVNDEGAGFEAKKLPNPLSKKNLLKENGRGVFLMRSLMDEVKYTRTKTGMSVRMKLKLMP
jgi:serine/threonine-protein kinase RsbW